MHALRGWLYTILLAVGVGLVGLVIGLSIPVPGAPVIAVLAVVAVLALGAAVAWRRRLWRM
ncbi:MAG: hypothetical protein R6U88_01910 [Candidatus Bipolaricaulota bacterium]